MFSSIRNFFLRDDRTGLPSITRFIRIWAWLIAISYTIMIAYLILFDYVFLDDRKDGLIELLKDFLVFIIPTVEASYQFNRKAKIDSPGMQELVEELARRENEKYFKLSKKETKTITTKKDIVVEVNAEDCDPEEAEEEEQKDGNER